jgi:hypothetical protein
MDPDQQAREARIAQLQEERLMLEVEKLRADMLAQQRRLDEEKTRFDRMFWLEVVKVCVAFIAAVAVCTAAINAYGNWRASQSAVSPPAASPAR